MMIMFEPRLNTRSRSCTRITSTRPRSYTKVSEFTILLNLDNPRAKVYPSCVSRTCLRGFKRINSRLEHGSERSSIAITMMKTNGYPAGGAMVNIPSISPFVSPHDGANGSSSRSVHPERNVLDKFVRAVSQVCIRSRR